MGNLTRKQALYVIAEMYTGKALKELMRTMGIDYREFYILVNSDIDLLKEYEMAQRARAEQFVEETLDIADNEQDPYRARVRTDIRKWYASKMMPSKFGDRIDVNVNQIVDVSKALLDARSRAQLPEPIKLIEINKADDESIYD